MNCCLCFANGQERAGRPLESSTLALCAEHRAQTHWRSRQVVQPASITLPATGEEMLLEAAARAALLGEPGPSLVPSDAA